LPLDAKSFAREALDLLVSAGLAERVAAHGGTIEAGPRADGGFAVAVSAPANGVMRSP
jgi:hypothetical protein